MKRTHPLALTGLVAALSAALLLAGTGCSGCVEKGTEPGPAPGSKGDAGEAEPVPPGEDVPQHGEIKEGDDAGRGGVTPGERRRLTGAVEAWKNSVFLNDPEGFEKGFWDTASLKSIIVSTRGKDAWKEMLRAGGGDELEFEKHYKNMLRLFFEDLREPGGRCGLSAASLKAVRKSGTPPELLFAGTFAYRGERSRVVVLAGFKDAETVAGVLRVRAMPHKNRLHWYYVGDERIDALSSLGEGEAERVAASLRSITGAQEAFRESKAVDRDGDGEGEFAFFIELAGAETPRGSKDPLGEVRLSSPLDEVSVQGMALGATHLFRVYLPGVEAPVAEERSGRPEPGAVTDGREKGWCALAWPAAKGTGKGLYFVGPSGTILRASKPSPFHGRENPPLPKEASRETSEDGGWGTLLEGPGSSTTGLEWVSVP